MQKPPQMQKTLEMPTIWTLDLGDYNLVANNYVSIYPLLPGKKFLSFKCNVFTSTFQGRG